jgi:hypothetical protein
MNYIKVISTLIITLIIISNLTSISNNIKANKNLKEKKDLIEMATNISYKNSKEKNNIKNTMSFSNNSIYIGIKIVKPENGLYFSDKKILPFIKPIIIGPITIKCEVFITEMIPIKVEFLIDNELKKTIYNEPYEWVWDETAFFSHEIKVKAISDPYEENSDYIDVSYFNIAT